MQPAVQSRYLVAAVPAPGPDDRTYLQVLRGAQIQPGHSAGTLRGTEGRGLDSPTTPPFSDCTRGDHEVPRCSCVKPNAFVRSETAEKMSLQVRFVLPRRHSVLPRSILCVRDARKSMCETALLARALLIAGPGMQGVTTRLSTNWLRGTLVSQKNYYYPETRKRW